MNGIRNESTVMRNNLKLYDVSDATHRLRCAHQHGPSRHTYTMPCRLLGRTKSRMCKVVVFGVRDWKGKDHVKRIRYVPSWKLEEI